MDVEVILPAEPVTLAPGVATRVPVRLRNAFGPEVGVRVSVTGGRVGAWASVEPATATVASGATVTVDLVLHPPADQPPSGSLMPFTVQAAADGAPAGFATGLLSVARPVPVVGELVARTGEPHTFDLRLANDSDGPAAIRLEARLDPPAGHVTTEPGAALLEPGDTLTAVVRARPTRPIMGAAQPYAVLLSVTDAHDPQRPPLFTATGTGRRPPRVTSLAAGIAALVLAVAATAAVAVSGARLPLPGRARTATQAAAPPTVTPVAVGRPFALVDVFPHRGADGGRAAAEAERGRLAAAGMPVRLVDSLASDQLADEGAGFWVLLQDGFATPAAAAAYCTQWRTLAPKCTVTS
ncbi:hypothetical protein [Krasilnikovia sp. MM14-A1004]|uniref:COG1470 family protein n=1 Tax=Krasilnikovia sp. MM14-A1004 TaxID=3373541 RepID=UPI00399C4C29